ncbi:MAG: hypothetical protein NVS2B14_00490 [Chamaesiphon sp.]
MRQPIKIRKFEKYLIWVGIGCFIVFASEAVAVADGLMNSKPLDNSILPFVNFLSIISTILIIALSSIGLAVYIIRLTNSINDLKAGLKGEFIDTKIELTRQIVNNREEILKVHSKFEVGLIETESSIELVQKDIVNIQKEMQNILRGLDKRIQRLEYLLEQNKIGRLHEPKINEDIEGL